MGLFAPWFLAGVVAIGLPIWIHLLKRHRTDPKPFPSVMFFEKREVSSVKHRKLEHILLFLLRCAMLFLLALLFAEPHSTALTALLGDDKELTIWWATPLECQSAIQRRHRDAPLPHTAIAWFSPTRYPSPTPLSNKCLRSTRRPKRTSVRRRWRLRRRIGRSNASRSTSRT
jgi:hypothetical protein